LEFFKFKKIKLTEHEINFDFINEDLIYEIYDKLQGINKFFKKR
jgi:hypothetical protein